MSLDQLRWLVVHGHHKSLLPRKIVRQSCQLLGCDCCLPLLARRHRGTGVSVDVRLEGTSVCEHCWAVIHSTHNSKVRIHTVHFRNVLQSRARTSVQYRRTHCCHIRNVRYTLACMHLPRRRLTVHLEPYIERVATIRNMGAILCPADGSKNSCINCTSIDKA